MTSNIPVPEWLRPGVSQALDFLPEATVREMGRRLPGGFTKRQAILDQWRRMARGFHEVPPDFPDTLRESLPVYELLQGLNPFQVGFWLPYLAPLAGPDLLAACLWLDRRPEVQALAQPELLAAPTPPPDEARAHWRKIVENKFLQPLGLSLPSPAPAPNPATPATPNPTEENDLARTRKWLADARRHLNESQTRHQTEIQALRQQHEAEVLSLTQQRDALAARVQELETSSSRQIRDEIARNLDAQIRPWHARVVAVEEHLETSESPRAKLVGDLRAALERQRKADRHQANLARLRDDLQSLLELRDQVQWTRSETLHPLGDWPTLVSRLEAAIVELRQQLHEIPAAARWAPDLAADLQSATTPAELEAVLARARHLAQASLLDSDALQWLARKATERRTALQDPLLRRFPPAPVRLREVLEGQASGVILIDAYNWIGRAGSILGVSTNKDHFPESLQQLKPLLRKLAARATRAEILLFADGPRENTVPWASNLRLTWSGGEGRNRADAVIRGHLEHLRKQAEPLPIWVVSDDGEVRAAAKHSEATIEICEAFARRVQVLLTSPATPLR